MVQQSVCNEYRRLFATEILAPLSAREVWESLHTLAGDSEPVLLCWEKPTDKNAWCHRAIVADWFREKLGFNVHELGYETSPKHPLALPGEQLLLGER